AGNVAGNTTGALAAAGNAEALGAIFAVAISADPSFALTKQWLLSCCHDTALAWLATSELVGSQLVIPSAFKYCNR
ncbi:MAG TPA: hypothetical protein DCW89_02990, partial [Oceanospirillaceae bacterium]|nr:hypothetical protein [Oceanospirillaceae bacterium]